MPSLSIYRYWWLIVGIWMSLSSGLNDSRVKPNCPNVRASVSGTRSADYKTGPFAHDTRDGASVLSLDVARLWGIFTTTLVRTGSKYGLDVSQRYRRLWSIADIVNITLVF
ncbi:hypothetical protein QCA50_010426 [Cerrena zonata]|uniref:Uncharacterized protein n=1 Tax=Cerrena zonata TaxID=2478898 RepID=A0AAW0G9A6_9APHY